MLYTIPNVPYDIVPEGVSADDNVVVKTGGHDTILPQNALPHWELAKKYNLIDFDLGVKITGAGFPVYIGQGARLQRALINFFLDEARKAGYTEIMPPTVVNAASGYGTGQLPDKEGQMYHCEVDDLYLIPTAEVPVTNIYRDVILNEEQLPIKNCAYTECFRREAGSYGKDVRGLNRLHEFSKIEIVRIDTPEHSEQSHQEMLAHVEGLLSVFMANAGGAWDNAKKYVEEGNYGGKGSSTHKATVVGDTVGDPFKDTSGPSLNILIKLMSMVSIVMAGLTIAFL